jgi:hypothetical protein
MATYTPDGETALEFHLLIDPPTRETRQTMSERVIPGTNSSSIDIIGKTVTKIRGQARFDSYAGLTTFEGAVGSTGVLVYSEEPAGLDVIFVSMQRTRVTKDDIHLASVEFWIIPSVSGTLVAPRRVRVSASASTAGGPVTIDHVLSARVSYGFDMRTGECRLVLPLKPDCTYDDELTVAMGAGGASGTDAPIVRFVGLIRDVVYQDGASTVTLVARGYLTRAIEYENGDETVYDPWSGAGGLLIPDLVGTLTGAPAAIVQSVLELASVPYTPANISGSGVVYGGGLSPLPFLWRSGGSGPNTVPMPQEQGESAMSYIERYDAIDAEIDAPNTGGRYRTFETLAGDVFRVRVGGRPQADPDFTLTEGVDVLGGNFTRSISQTHNRFVVKGQDRGQGFGALNFVIDGSNDFQPAGSKHTYQFGSDMVERANNDAADTGQAATGMSCETLATALELEYNRELVSGWVETFRDDAFGIAQTHLVQGGPGGTVGALGLAENVWVQSLEISVDERGFTQRVSYLGGGLPAGVTADVALLRTAMASVA